MPQSSGDGTPAGGGTSPPITLNIRPTKPSGVQLARPIRPPERHTRTSSAAERSGLGANITPTVESTRVERAVLVREVLGVGHLGGDVQAVGLGAPLRQAEQRVDVVGARHVGTAAGGGERRVAVAGRDVEHLGAGGDVDRFAERLADDLQRGADHGVVAGGPRGLLLGLDLPEIVGAERGGHGSSRVRRPV